MYAHVDFASRWLRVVDKETEEQIPKVRWFDTDTGEVAVLDTRWYTETILVPSQGFRVVHSEGEIVAESAPPLPPCPCCELTKSQRDRRAGSRLSEDAAVVNFFGGNEFKQDDGDAE